MRLTDEQREAVNEGGHVCLVSCPGSGKTRAIVAKLIFCIEDVRGTMRRVACITHTNAAAHEVEVRLRQLCFGDEDTYYEVTTIHAFALRFILNPYFQLLPELREGFVILTQEHDEYTEKAGELATRYELEGYQADSIEQIYRLPNGNPAPKPELPAALKREWFAWLDENRYVTLNDIMYHAARILKSFPYVASGLSSLFAWMLLDEFQDSSPSQIALLVQLHKFARTTFFCVGDPNQSIYGFAGASPKLLNQFAEHVGANNNLKLTGNFRCSQGVIATAEKLCSLSPPMRAVGESATFPVEPMHFCVEDPLDGIVTNFLPALTAHGIALGKSAILAPQWPALFHLARALRAQGVPVIGPGARPYKRNHLLAPLVEAVAAFLESPEPDIANVAQRELFFLLSNLNEKNPHGAFTFSGRVALCRLFASASAVRQRHPKAVGWLYDASGEFADLLQSADLIGCHSAGLMVSSGNEIAKEIAARQGGENLSIEDLGIFARPNHCLHLMTIHKSKGREFEAVAVIDAHDGKLPHFSIARIEDDAQRQAEYDECQRLVYVATTRAEKLLMFFTDSSHYKNRPSPFLSQMGLM